MIRFLALAALALPLPALAQQTAPKVGDSFQILRQHQISQQSAGSSSTSSNSDAMIERVTAVKPDGLELEYDVAPGSDGGWQFPVRVFRPSHGAVTLVNAKELDSRVDAWLQANGLTRAACGRWVRSWTAFRIECDPQSVLKTVAGLQMEPEALKEGAPVSVPGARGTGALVRKGDRRFVAELAVDPEAVRKERADNDIGAAEINGEKLAPDAARKAHAGEAISGTIIVTFDLDDAGRVGRRTTVTKVEIKNGAQSETQTITEVLQRQGTAKPPRDPNMI